MQIKRIFIIFMVLILMGFSVAATSLTHNKILHL